MKVKYAWVVVLLCLSVETSAQNDRITLLRQACRQFDSALIAHDTTMLSTLLTEGFRMKHSNGLEEKKKELLKHVDEGFLKYNKIVQEGDAEIHLEEELGFVIRSLSVEGTLQGKDFNVRLKANELWTYNYKSRIWQLRNRQSVKAN